MFPRHRRVQTVLVVEDDSNTRELYRRALIEDGYRVIAVEDGLDALHRIELERPAAVVLDLMLPRLDGYDVYKELRSDPATSTVPVIIVTGSDVRELESDTYRYFLRKPFRGEDLIEIVQTAIQSSATL